MEELERNIAKDLIGENSDEIEADREEVDSYEQDEYSQMEQLKILATSKAVLERHGYLKSTASHAFAVCQKSLRLEREAV